MLFLPFSVTTLFHENPGWNTNLFNISGENLLMLFKSTEKFKTHFSNYSTRYEFMFRNKSIKLLSHSPYVSW
jgi:hypothetical protein